MRALACLLLVAICLCISADAALRIYYVQAEEVDWNYAPSGMNNLAGVPLADDVHSAHYFKKSDKVIGGTFIKAIYVQYTDGSFTTKKKRDDREEHLGILGPILYGEVGDTIQVVFSNAASFNFSIHPHGVFYSKESEGAKYPDGAFPAGDYIAPGQKYTYSWPVPARAGPGPGDFSSVVWPYHTHVSEVFSSVSGLVGVFVITSKGQAWPDGRPKEVDREFVLFLQVFNENNSGYLPMNIAKYLPDQVNNSAIHLDPEFVEGNKLTSINGYCFGNLPGLHMKAGERVRWYVYALGAEEDIHTIHWHGNTLLDRQHRTTTEIVLPATVLILDMIPDNVGRWNVQCHVNEHITAGQVANYTVEAAPHYMDSSRNFATTHDPFSFLFSPQAPVIIINDATTMFVASFSLVFVCMLFAVL